MELVRQCLNIAPEFPHALAGLFEATLGSALRSRKSLFHFLQIHCQQDDTLTKVVMQFSGNPVTLLFVRFNQSAVHAGKSFFCKFAPCNVQSLGDEILRLTVRTSNQRCARFGCNDAPTLVPAALLNSLETRSSLKGLLKPLGEKWPVFGKSDRLHRLLEQFLLGIAKKLAKCLVGGEKTTLGRNDHHAHTRIPKDPAELLLARTQFVLGMLAFSDVLSGTAQPRDAAGRIAHHFTSVGDPSCAAVGTKDLQIEFVRSSGSQCLRDGALQAFPAFWCIQLCLFTKGGRRQVGIAAPDSAEFLGPSDRVGFWVPLPVADLRHA